VDSCTAETCFRIEALARMLVCAFFLQSIETRDTR